MPVPKQRKTKSRRNQRRSHHALKKISFAACPKCKEPILPHRVCLNCGVYNGREAMKVESPAEKKARKKKKST